MRHTLIFIFIFLTSLAFSKEGSSSSKIMESFENGIPSTLTARGGRISLDTLRYKHGEKALKWDWVGNDALIFNTPIGYRKQRDLSKVASVGRDKHLMGEHSSYDNKVVLENPRGFFMWIYNEKATTQHLIFQFGRDEVVDCEFNYNLNFVGWRTVWIVYDRGDMRGAPHPDMNRMTILAPNVGSGIFYMDAIGLSLPLNPRNNAPNMQLPYIDPHPRLVTQYAQRLLEHYSYRPFFSVESLTNSMNEALNELNKKVEEFILPIYSREVISEKGIEDIRKRIEKFEIQRVGESIYGRPLVKDTVYKEYFREMGLGSNIMDGHMSWRHDFCKTMFDIATRYRSISDNSQRAELEGMFVDLFDYGVDQGFAVGAGLGWLHHYSYVIREYGPAVFLMRDVLDKHDRLDSAVDIMKWFYGFGQVYREDLVYGVKDRKSADADDTQGLLMPRLYTVLTMKNSPEKVRDLRHFSSFFSNVTSAYANALDEVYKPDGTAFHHAGHAQGYGGRGVHGGVATMYLLSDSPFKVTKDAYGRLKKITRTLFDCLFTEDFVGPRAFASIRFSSYELPDKFYYLPALVALSSDSFDSEMAGFYKQIMAGKTSLNEMDRYWLARLDEQGGDTAYNYAKSRMLSYSCVATRRENNDWMATVRGHSKYVYPYESWGTGFFAYPTFIANGYLDVSYPNDLDSTQPVENTWLDGYDWHRWPGTTSVHLPYEQIITSPGQQRDEGGEYPFSDQAFVGGVETIEGNALFAFPFKGHDMFGLQSFSGIKTYFFFGGFVVCLGSNITSKIDGYDVETTLLQNQIVADQNKLITSEGMIETFPFRESKDRSQPFWILDSRKTGYYIPELPQHTTLEISCAKQTNPGYQAKDMREGGFSTVLFNHGAAPTNSSYHYAVVMNASEQKMKTFTSEMTSAQQPYVIVRKDQFAHIVSSPKYATTSYAIFDETVSFNQGFVKSVNRPATFIVSQEKDALKLAVSDPDLNIYDGQDDLMPDGTRRELSIYEREWYYWPSRSSKVQITLKGNWKIEKQLKEMETAKQKRATIVSNNASETVIEFECRDGLSSEVSLIKGTSENLVIQV